MTELLHSSVAYIVRVVGKLGYAGIILLMGLESSFFPFPSEVVVPPAGYLAHTGEMNLLLVILCGILGSILGSLFNYYIAVYFGRSIILRFGKYFFITEEKFAHVERYFEKHGEITTFVGRLIPAVRQLISFPAGLARMHMGRFLFYTTLGAGIWVTILAYVGYLVGNNIELVKNNLSRVTMILVPALLLIVVVYIFSVKRKKKLPM